MLRDFRRKVEKSNSLPALDHDKSAPPQPPPHRSPSAKEQPKERQWIMRSPSASPSASPTPSIQQKLSHSKGFSGGQSQSSSRSTLSLSIPSTPTSPAPRSRTPNRLVSTGSLLSIGSDQLLDHSHLKPGANAELLSYTKTINMYRENAKKTNDFRIQCDFAIFLVEAAKRLEQKEELDEDCSDSESTKQDRRAYMLEAEKLLKQVALRGYPEAQYYLANMYAAGLLHKSGKPEFDKAFPLYAQAAKHHNPDAAFRTGKCYEDALGTRRDKAKAAQYYRKSASLNHPGAMYRLGLAEINGDLGMNRNVREGHNWLKRSAEAATPLYPHALHELALLHEKGFDAVIFADHAYAVRLYKEAVALGYVPSALRLGEIYEFGRLGCSIDPVQSIQYYTIAAEQGHPEACFALTAWYLVGGEGVEASDEKAFLWVSRAANLGLPKAEYALGYFYEVGIGTDKKIEEAVRWYATAAAHGEKRASQRLHQLPARYRSSGQHAHLTLSPSMLSDNKQVDFLSKAKRLFVKRDSTPSVNFV